MKKSTKIIIAVVSVIVVAAAVVVTLFLTGVLGSKKPKKAFYEYLDKAIPTGEASSAYSDCISTLKKSQNDPYKSKGKMSMDVQLGSYLSEYKKAAEILNKIEVSYESKVNPSSSAAYATMNLKYDGEELGKFELLSDDKQVGIKVADVYDKYLTISYDEVKDLLKDSGVDMDLPTNISTDDIDMDAIIDILDISNDEIKRIVDRYKKVLEDTIPEENYSSKKEDITVNGKEIKATGYSVKITSKDLNKLAKAMIESLKDDNDTLNMVVDKVNKLMELSGQRMSISKRDITSALDAALSSIDDSSSSSSETLKITVYEYKNETVRLAIEIQDSAIYIDTMKDGDTENMAIKMKANGIEMTLLNMEQTKKGDGKYTTKLSTDLQGIKLEVTLDTEETENSAKVNGTMYIEVPSMIKATLRIETELEYTSVSVDRLSSSNTTKIKSMTTSDQQELVQGVLDYIDDKMDIIKDIAKVLGYENEIKEFEKNLNAAKQPLSSITSEETEENDDAA